MNIDICCCECRIEVNEDPRLVDTYHMGVSESIKQVLLFPQSSEAAREGKLDDLRLAVVDASSIRVLQLSIQGSLEPYASVERSMVTWNRLEELDLQEFGKNGGSHHGCLMYILYKTLSHDRRSSERDFNSRNG